MRFTLTKLHNPLKFIFRNYRVKYQKSVEDKNINKIDKNYMEDGTDITWSDTQNFTFPIKGGRVIKVYDADTITIATKLPYDDSPLYRLSVRLSGIDTPELAGNNISNDEKDAAKMAKNFVYNLAINKYVRLEDIHSEKYGRILANVYIGETNLNNLLLKERYAVKYNGGTKNPPKSWLKYRLTGEFNM